MAIEMEVADNGRGKPLVAQNFYCGWYGPGGIVIIDGPADEFRPRFDQFNGLGHGLVNISGRRIGHGLNNNRISSPYRHMADFNRGCFSALEKLHEGTP